uniref:Uncharacterized protein n=1 Tax=Rhizophora mucronata TaxID=61149 RepID=A0A2P2PQ90_RHIMU
MSMLHSCHALSAFTVRHGAFYLCLIFYPC